MSNLSKKFCLNKNIIHITHITASGGVPFHGTKPKCFPFKLKLTI